MLAKIAEHLQKRAIFFVFDGGTGVGHLRRLACIARELQGSFSCLIVTGHRAAAHWFIPEECEYVHLPSWDSLLESKARYWGRKPFICLSEGEAIQLRKNILRGVVEAFEPDVIFVDHLPLGAHEELADIIERTPCLKYIVTRGVLNESNNLCQLILGGKAHKYLESYYNKILVACDQKVVNFSKQYNISPEIRQKTVHTGYVVENLPRDIIGKIRHDYGVKSSDTWVVASAGGGQMGEPLIQSCMELAREHRDVIFDIVLGPRSRLLWEDKYKDVIVNNNLRLHKETYRMPYLHAGANLVISSGGYNSILEALQGNAKIICIPYWTDRRDEQYRHAACLKSFVDIDVSTELSELPALFEQAVGSSSCRKLHDRRGELDFNGAAVIREVILADLRQSQSVASTAEGHNRKQLNV